MFELLNRYKPTHVLQLPQNQDPETALPLWRRELQRFKEIVEKETGRSITQDRLQGAIQLMNRERRARKDLMDLNMATPAPLRGSELLEILFKVGFLANKEKGIELMDAVVASISDENEKACGCALHPANREESVDNSITKKRHLTRQVKKPVAMQMHLEKGNESF